MKARFDRWHLANITLLGVLSLFLSLLYCDLNNTLHANGNWTSGKVPLKRGVMGAIGYLTTTVALSQNRLDLSAWHGFQELVLNKRTVEHEVSFDFTLDDERSYLFFFFRRSGDLRTGLRLSRKSWPPSGFVVVDDEGKFTQRGPPVLADIDLTHGTLRMTVEGGDVELLVNGKKLVVPESFMPGAAAHFVGFKGGKNRATVDSVSIDPTTPNAFFESFDNYGRSGVWFGLAFGLLIAAYFVLVKVSDAAPLHLALTNVIFAAGVTTAYTLHFNQLSATYPDENAMEVFDYPVWIESEDDAKKRLRELASAKRNDDRFTILFVGSSQTWGAGASRAEDTFVNRLNRKLNAAAPEEGRVVCVNAGISGWVAAETFEEYARTWVSLKPRVVLINLSNNDSVQAPFEESLVNFVELNDNKGIRTVFILEANSPEEGLDGLLENHGRMKRIAAERGVMVIDLHGHLSVADPNGLLWWDNVHLTDYGHEVAAQTIFNERARWLKGFEPR